MRGGNFGDRIDARRIFDQNSSVFAALGNSALIPTTASGGWVGRLLMSFQSRSYLLYCYYVISFMRCIKFSSAQFDRNNSCDVGRYDKALVL